MPAFWLTLQGIVAFVGPVLLGWWLHRRLGVRWRTWALGALAFVGSQAIRLPLLIGLTVGSRSWATGLTEGEIFWLNFVVLLGTAALFEEGARYVVLRWWARDSRRWRDAVMFGAGHGGIEAILLVGLGVVSNLVVLSTGDAILAQLEGADPAQVEAVTAQLETLRTLAWWMPMLALWERVLAILFHIAASIWVMLAVRDGDWRWLALAMALHVVFNAIALLALRYLVNPIAVEGVLTIVAPLFVWIIARTRRQEPPPPSIPA